jgi:hypothetical protein
MSRSAMLWLELLAGPIVWFVSLCANFALAGWACVFWWQPGLRIVAIAAMAITAAAGYMSWRDWHQLGREFPGEAGGSVARSRALASGGVLLNGMFVLVILTQLIVSSILSGCE